MKTFFAKYKHDILALLMLTLIWLVFVWPLLHPSSALAIWKDNEFLLAPLFSHMSMVMRAGEWPLWMDSIISGMPLYNLTQVSAFYPLYFLPLPIFGDGIAAQRAMHNIIVFHFLIFSINAYVLMRVLRASRLAAVLGAVLMVFNANMMAYAGWINIIAPYTWLPLYLAGLIMLLSMPYSRRSFLTTLFAICMLTLASPAQPLIHAVLITIVICVAYAVKQLRSRTLGDQRLLLRAILVLACVSILAMLITAPVLYPAITEFAQMYRWVGDFPPLIGNERIPFAAFLTDQVSPSALAGVLFVNGEKLLVGSIYIGLLPVALACATMFFGARHWVVIPLAIVALYALLSSTGSHLGFAYVNYEIPLLNKIREPSRFLILTHFAVAILAALSIDRISQLINPPINITSTVVQYAKRALGAALLTFTVGALVGITYWGKMQSSTAIVVPLMATFAVLMVAVYFYRRGLHRWAGIATTIIVCVTIAAQWKTVTRTVGVVAQSDYMTQQMLDLDLALAALKMMDPKRQYRVIFDGDINKQQASMLASYHGIRSLNAYINPAPKKLMDENYYHGPRTPNYFGALGAKYLLCRVCKPETTFGFQLVKTIGAYEIYEGVALARHFITTEIAGEYQSISEYAAKIAALDLRKNPVLIQTGAWRATANHEMQHSAGTCVSDIRYWRNNSISLLTQCTNKALLVLNEFDGGAWRARINGNKSQLLPVNGNQIGLALPKGTSLVEIYYSPLSSKIGWVLCAVGLFLLMLIMHLMRRYTARNANEHC